MRENGDTFVPVGAKEKKDHCHLGSESICRQDDIHIHRLTATDRAHNGQPFQANVMKKKKRRTYCAPRKMASVVVLLGSNMIGGEKNRIK